MLSILIPTYNYDCRLLVGLLHEQCTNLGIDFELIVADDGSTSSQWIINRAMIEKLRNARFIRREENVGRSSIRNYLMTEAKGNKLMLMDQDGVIISNDFIARYIEAGKEHDVVCGGIKHSDTPPSNRYSLRYKYEKQYERRNTAEVLNANPHSQFRSFCFLISREVAERVKMDERFINYGYEDVRYGMDLRRAGYEIFNINNPLQNNDIEPNPKFVAKTETAMHTMHEFRAELANDCTLLIQVAQLQRTGLIPLLRFTGRCIIPLLRKNLCSNYPIVGLFNIYKLLYYINI